MQSSTHQDDNIQQLQPQLIDAIRQSLHFYLPSNAAFLAQRLVAQRDCQENRGLLAECYIAQGKHFKAQHVLKDCTSQANRYKFALCCIKMGKYKDAEKALGGSNASARPDIAGSFNKPAVAKIPSISEVPHGSHGLYLLGYIAEKTQRYSDAKLYYGKAFQNNPTLWTAFEKLGRFGENLQLGKAFGDVKYRAYAKTAQVSTPLVGSIVTKKKDEEEKEKEKPSSYALKRPSTQAHPPTITQQATQSRKRVMSAHENPFPNLMALLRKLGEGYNLLCQYNCSQAIKRFKQLPSNHFETGWVLTKVGRAYMEMVRYSDAAFHYQQAYRVEPHRTDGLEHYSSCLWHLKKQAELCHLANQVLERSLYVPQAWIAVGNCFSIQKQHENAIKFFQRAIQIQPDNPYAYSLCGHQYVACQDFQKARKMFQAALNYDLRHYNAWWGLGNLAYKQEKYSVAIEHFSRAISINPCNPVLYSFMGMTQAATNNYPIALSYFERSETIDPKNGLNRYQKANTLVKLERYEQAISELENLQKLMPKQPPIPMLLGNIYRKVGTPEKAHYYFNMAIDLESKDAQKIKSFIESLHNTQPDQEDVEM